MINQIIGRAGVLRDVGSDGFIRDENNVLMRGPKGGFLAVSKDGQFVLDLDMAQLRVHESGSVPQEAAIFRIAAGPTANVGRVVDLAGNRFPDTPTTITDLKTGQTVEESQVRATAAASGGATQNYLILAGIALVAYMAMRRRR